MPVSYFQCSQCGQKFKPEQVTYTCTNCAGNLDTHFTFEEDPAEVNPAAITESKEYSIWRYAPLLPVGETGFDHTPLHRVVFTPVYQPE